MNPAPWTPPPPGPLTPEDTVDVWRIALDAAVPTAEGRAILSPDEQARADRLLSPAKRLQFVCTRAALRQILARYLDADPRAVQIIDAEPHRKPVVACGGVEPPLQFNVSHSDGLALCAVTRHKRVGIDVEPVVADRPLRDIADRFFHPRERALLAALPPDEMVPAFYRCWTAKEALLKATGHGLHHPLDSFAIDLDPSRPLALLEGTLPHGETLEWTFESVPLHGGYAAACVVEGRPTEWRFWEYHATIRERH